MATLSNVGDNVTLFVPDRNEQISISLSGTYDMVIQLQVELGSKGSGVWKRVRTYSTPNATVADNYTTPAFGEHLRLIVVKGTSGSVTATLIDNYDKVVLDINDEVGNDIITYRQSGVVVHGNLNVVGALTAATIDIEGEVGISGTPEANEYARWTNATTLEGRTASEVRSDLSLTPGTDTGDIVQLEDVGGNPGLPAVDGSQLTNIPSGTLASQSDAETGTDNSDYMSPLRTAQAIIAQTDALARLQHNTSATDAPAVEDDTTQGYSACSLWFDLTGEILYFCVDPAEGAADWVALNDVGALAALDEVPGHRMHFGLTELDATSGNVTLDGDTATLVVRVHGTPGTARNFTITPAPDVSTRSFLVINDTDDDVNVLDHAATTIDTLSTGTWQSFDWASSAWTAGAVFPGGSGSGTTTFSEDVAPVDVDDAGTLTAASHGEFYIDGTTLKRRKVRLRNSSNQASTVTVTVEDGLTQRIVMTVAADQTGAVTIQRDSTATINGGTSVVLGGPGASAVLIPGPTNVYNLEGETTEAVTFGGAVTVEGNTTLEGTLTVEGDTTFEGEVTGFGVNVVTAGAGSSQPTAALSGAYITTDGAITIPNSAIGGGWFRCTLEFGGDHDITFNSITLDISGVGDGYTTGDVVEVVVKSATTIRVIGSQGVTTQAAFA